MTEISTTPPPTISGNGIAASSVDAAPTVIFDDKDSATETSKVVGRNYIRPTDYAVNQHGDGTYVGKPNIDNIKIKTESQVKNTMIPAMQSDTGAPCICFVSDHQGANSYEKVDGITLRKLKQSQFIQDNGYTVLARPYNNACGLSSRRSNEPFFTIHVTAADGSVIQGEDLIAFCEEAKQFV